MHGGPDPISAVPGALPHEQVDFAHNAERQFAALLDFYGVDWAYEPRTFVLAEGADGLPTMAFTPDFHLPDANVYVEITTLRQRLVTRKNRKVRLLRERHPEVEVRVLYQRDYLELIAKYGLEAPSQSAGSGRRPRATATEAAGLLGLSAQVPAGERATRRPTSAA